MKKSTAYFCLVIGFLNLFTWTYLLVNNKVPGMDKELLAFVFHWISEFITAVLLIVSGVMILRNNRMRRYMFFIASGFLLNAINGAFWYYLANFDPFLFIMMVVILIFTLLFAGLNYNNWKHLLFLALGFCVYGELNILGDAVIANKASLLIMIIPMMALTTIALIIFYLKTMEKVRAQ